MSGTLFVVSKRAIGSQTYVHQNDKKTGPEKPVAINVDIRIIAKLCFCLECEIKFKNITGLIEIWNTKTRFFLA